MSVDFRTRKSAYEKGKKMVPKVVVEKEEAVVWVLEDWKTCWHGLMNNATCTVDMGTTTLRFALGDPIPDDTEGKWLSLLVQLKNTSDSNEAMEKTFKFQVDRLKENLDLDCEIVPETCITLDGSEKVILGKKFIELCEPFPENLRFGLIITAINFQSAAVGIELAPDVVKEPSNSSGPEKPEAIVRLTWKGNEKGSDIKASAFGKSPFLRRQIEIAELKGQDSARLHICLHLDAKVMDVIFEWLSTGTFTFSLSNMDFKDMSMYYAILAAAKALELTDLLQHIDQNITSFVTKTNRSDILHDVKALGLENATTAIGKMTL